MGGGVGAGDSKARKRGFVGKRARGKGAPALLGTEAQTWSCKLLGEWSVPGTCIQKRQGPGLLRSVTSGACPYSGGGELILFVSISGQHHVWLIVSSQVSSYNELP